MESVDKKQLWYALRRGAWLILLVAMIATILSFVVTQFFMTPMYTASTKMYVNNSSFTEGSSGAFSASEITAAQSLVETYIVILNSRPTLTEVIVQAQVPYGPDQLAGMISAAPVNDTEIFEVTVTCADPVHSERIANTISEVLPRKISETVLGSSVSVVDYAIRPSQPSSPNLIKNLILGFIIGAVLSTTAIILIEMMDDKVRSEEHLTRVYEDVPLLTVVPDVYSPKTGGKGYSKDYYAQSYKRTEEKR